MPPMLVSPTSGIQRSSTGDAVQNRHAVSDPAVERASAPRPFLRPSARASEHRHRSTLLLGISALLLLSLTPVVGQHVFFAAHAPLTGIDHIGAVCLVALHLLLEPVHEALHVVLLVGVGYAVWDRGRAWLRARRSLAVLHASRPAPGDAVWTAAAAAGVFVDRVRVVEGLPVPAFTAGWIAPAIYVARDLAVGPRRLSDAELVAVLAHEGAHVRRRDPLRFSLLRAMACALFWLPALRRLADDVADEAEVRADDAAATRAEPLVLAAAIVALAGWRSPPDFAGAPSPTCAPDGVGFVRPDLVERRVRRLAGEATEPVSRVTRRSLWAAALALGIVWVAGIVHVHPMPHGAGEAGAAARHCDHADGSVLSHLFCRHAASGALITLGDADCPHRDQALTADAAR